MSEMQAAFGLGQLEKIRMFNSRRKKCFLRISSHLDRYRDCLLLPSATPKSDPSWFAFGIVVRSDAPFRRKQLVEWMEHRGIETRPFLGGDVTKQPAYSNIKLEVRGGLENTSLASNNGFFFGCHHGMTDQMVEYVLQCFDDFIDETMRS
jgi:CDP-6-deoxy-D-xylo-4-hexulose-3-dehydrase